MLSLQHVLILEHVLDGRHPRAHLLQHVAQRRAAHGWPRFALLSLPQDVLIPDTVLQLKPSLKKRFALTGTVESFQGWHVMGTRLEWQASARAPPTTRSPAPRRARLACPSPARICYPSAAGRRHACTSPAL